MSRGRVARATLAGAVGAVAGLAAVLVACGDRTTLPIEGAVAEGSGPPPGRDAGRDAREPDVRVDSARDTGPIGFPDVAVDVPPDIYDAPFDIATDVRPPSDCPDAAATLVYVITGDDELYSFYPPTATFTPIGTVKCPGVTSAFSMAVDHKGIAYVLFQDKSAAGAGGPIFQVDTATAKCTPLPYKPGQHGFQYFGMGFAADTPAPTETLYIQGDSYYNSGEAKGLASVDTTTWIVTPIGVASPALAGGELTGTGAGDLFSLFSYADMVSRVGQLDKKTGDVIASVVLPSILSVGSDSFAVAFWGGDFYLFTNDLVNRFDPMTGATTFLTSIGTGKQIVGAGVSTCAPE